jgi:hypothetical protein
MRAMRHFGLILPYIGGTSGRDLDLSMAGIWTRIIWRIVQMSLKRLCGLLEKPEVDDFSYL